MSSFLSADSIQHSYVSNEKERLEVLKNISLDLEEGSITAIVGPSGCGKSTLIRLLAGLEEPTSGVIKIRGVSAAAYRQNYGIGVVFQKPHLFPWRTVLENACLPLEISPLAHHKEGLSIDNVLETLNKLGLGDFTEAYPSQLSGGMLQRAALARAMTVDPGLAYLDEPFSSVDELTREDIWVDFRSLWREKNLTVVLVTHSISEAVYLGDQVLVMTKWPGRIFGSMDNSNCATRDRSWLSEQSFFERCSEVRELLRNAAEASH
ncbi:MAG: ABC transporter ATP-binding protein [Candidatus Thiodiazotropha endolucinida]